MRIIVIDNNDADLRLICARLRHLYPDAPWTIEIASTGASGLNLLRRRAGQRCLVLCDERMQAFNGSDILNILGREDLLRSFKFVLMSDHPMPNYPTHLGAQQVCKPNHLHEYDAMLQGIVSDWMPVIA